MKAASLAVFLSWALILQTGCGGSGSPNPPPAGSVTITSTPSLSASEGQTYNYVVTATTTGQGAIAYQLTSGPAGASVSGSTLTWVPTAAESRKANSFVLTAQAGMASASQSWTVTPAGAVHGSDIVNYITDSGPVQQPSDASQMTIAAVFPDGNGGFSTHSGTGLADGSYSIPDVPGGSYWMEAGTHPFVQATSSQLDTGRDVAERTALNPPTIQTPLDLDLTGLNPWQQGDLQQLFVSNANTWISLGWDSGEMDDGATTLTQQINWTSPLIDGGQGDRVYVTQLATTPTAVEGMSVQALAKSLGPLEVNQPDGIEVSISGELDDVEEGGTFRGKIQGSAFAQLEPAMNPSAAPDSTYFYLDVQPGGTAKGWIGNTPDLVFFDGTGEPIRTDIDTGDIAYGNPYPEAWGLFLDYIHYVRVDYTVAGAAPLSTYATLEVQSTTLPSLTNPVMPLVGPVASPKINDVSFFLDQTSVGTTPILSWTAPAVGQATGYTVEIYHLFSDGTFSQQELVGELYTTNTSIQLPPGLLTAGNTYFFCLSAIDEPGVDYTTAPFRHSFPRGVAQSLSGVVAP